jgi:hypothetical protein
MPKVLKAKKNSLEQHVMINSHKKNENSFWQKKVEKTFLQKKLKRPFCGFMLEGSFGHVEKRENLGKERLKVVLAKIQSHFFSSNCLID